jgi:D-alanyl-D-alanine carboxypeptidase/D-alanyl-D-alanine-endopeptidase (penicillin-binding protein 4)
MVDGGRTSTKSSTPRAQDPALEAGRQLAALLHLRTPVARGTSPAAAVELAHVESATVGELVETMLARSDNDLAEALGRQVALATRLPATFEGETAATTAVLGPLLDRARIGRAALQLRDASGLSPLSRLQPAALTRLLALVGADDRYAPVLSGLPVAGFDGTLQKRYREAPSSAAAGVVRAKTGTLNGVSALAGLVRTRSGHLLAFDVTADGIDITGNSKAQAALDRVATVLAGCGCT